MSDQEVRPLPDWARPLAGMMFLAGCAAKAVTSRKPQVNALPYVEARKPAVAKPRKKSNPSPEVKEFMRLPPHIQRQVLDYARNWIAANFEKTD